MHDRDLVRTDMYVSWQHKRILSCVYIPLFQSMVSISVMTQTRERAKTVGELVYINRLN